MTTTTEPAADRAATLLASVRELCPSIVERGEDIEQARRIPADLHEQLREIGLYRMLLPQSHGGDQIGLVQTLPVIEALAEADASVAWTGTIGLQSPPVFSLLPRPTFDEIYARHGPDVTIGGAIAPVGRAHAVEGGYRVESAEWPFASGLHNWDYLFANCTVFQDGEPVPDPGGGGPLQRVMVFPQRHVRILDTWKTLGLRGTGSNHFALDAELFVPAGYVSGSMLDAVEVSVPGLYPYPIVEFSFHICATLVGLAQGAINDLLSFAATHKRRKAAKPLAEQPAVHYRLGSAQAELSAARDAMYRRSRQLLDGELGDDFLSLVVRAWADNARTADLVTDIVQTCFRLQGAAGIWDGNPLQRRLRDAFTITQHASTNDQALTRAGAALLGQPVGLQYA